MNARSDVTDFIVEGIGIFPFDMLRTDECWPSDLYSVANLPSLNRLIGHKRGEITRRQVKLRTYRSFNIHPKRWESFGWKVTYIESERYGDITPLRDPESDETERLLAIDSLGDSA